MTQPSLFGTATEGFFLGAGLIVAIGAQNAFVLRQGLARRHVFAVTTLCALSDVVLIAAGVAGLGRLVEAAPALLAWITVSGALFLAAYGGLAFWRAVRPGRLVPAERGETRLAATLATALAFTFLNPHVYLDTVVLIGALASRYRGFAAAAFAGGAAAASVVWFYGLGFGARLIAPVFSRPGAWRVLDVGIGVVMWAIAVRLVAETLSAGR
jgi:L-lysine exporter family protein LysE/ArgO